MGRKNENCSFLCENCGREVVPLTNGSYRNHCPYCLYSKHVDDIPGDRLSKCKGLMKPVGLEFKPKKGFQIVHECIKCGVRKVNKVAESTAEQDDTNLLIKFLRSPLS